MLGRFAWSWIRFVAELTIIPGMSVSLLSPISLFPGRAQANFQLSKFKSPSTKTYALVTGCTSGIGLEFARQLAAKGFGLILVGRRQGALDELAAELQTKYKAPSKTVIADAADAAGLHAAVKRVADVASEVDLGILVNNVGASHEMPVAFAETSPSEIDQIIQTNVSWTLQLTRALLPSLIQRSANGGPKSLVLNLGSMSGRIPSSLLATYSGTKAGLQTWNTALATEVEPKGVIVRMILPAFVVSNMSKIRRASLTVPTAKDYVKATLSSIGLARGAQGRPYTSTPYPSHAVLDYVVSLFGYFTENIGVKVIDNMHKSIRARALKKKQREAAKKQE